MIESKKDEALAGSTDSDKDIAKGRLVIRVRTALKAGLRSVSEDCTSNCECHSSCDCQSHCSTKKI
jgi:hypothetical protein